MTGPQHSGDWSDADVLEHVRQCAAVQAHPLHVLAVMFSESGARATAHNANGDAVGLIQFMPATLRNMGFAGDWKAFAALGVTGQLPFVGRYLAPHRGQYATAAHVYLAVFLPACLTWPGLNQLTVITAPHGPLAFAYAPNIVFDQERKGYITLGDIGASAARASSGARWTELAGRILAVMQDRPTDPELPEVREDNRDEPLDPEDPPVMLLPDLDEVKPPPDDNA